MITAIQQVAVNVRDDFQHACAPESFEGLRVWVYLALLRPVQSAKPTRFRAASGNARIASCVEPTNTTSRTIRRPFRTKYTSFGIRATDRALTRSNAVKFEE